MLFMILCSTLFLILLIAYFNSRNITLLLRNLCISVGLLLLFSLCFSVICTKIYEYKKLTTVVIPIASLQISDTSSSRFVIGISNQQYYFAIKTEQVAYITRATEVGDTQLVTTYLPPVYSYDIMYRVYSERTKFWWPEFLLIEDHRKYNSNFTLKIPENTVIKHLDIKE